MRRQLALTIEVFLISTVLWDSQADGPNGLAFLRAASLPLINTGLQRGDTQRTTLVNRLTVLLFYSDATSIEGKDLPCKLR